MAGSSAGASMMRLTVSLSRIAALIGMLVLSGVACAQGGGVSTPESGAAARSAGRGRAVLVRGVRGSRAGLGLGARDPVACGGVCRASGCPVRDDHRQHGGRVDRAGRVGPAGGRVSGRDGRAWRAVVSGARALGLGRARGDRSGCCTRPGSGRPCMRSRSSGRWSSCCRASGCVKASGAGRRCLRGLSRSWMGRTRTRCSCSCTTRCGARR